MAWNSRFGDFVAGQNGDDRRRIAGGSLVVAGTLVTIGLSAAGALYPDYSIQSQTISALGATDASGRLVQPAATVFTLTMGLAGGLVLLAAFVGRSLLDRWLQGGLAVTGLGVLGVAAFPAHVGAPHAIAALAAFVGGGVTALLAARGTGGPIAWLSAVLGAFALVALATFLALGGSTPLGPGGLERLVSLPIQCWAILFGGWLLGRTGEARPANGF